MAVSGEITFHDKDALKRVAEIVAGKLHLFGDQVVERARDNAPVDTGNLKRSITAEKTGEQSLTIQTRCGYGAFVELGTTRRAATPYLAPAVQQTMSDLLGDTPWA